MNVVLALGLTNWIVTLVITGSVMFEAVRNWFDQKLADSAYIDPHGTVLPGFDHAIAFSRFWGYAGYLVKCPLCVRIWVSLISTAFVGPVILTGLTGFVLTWFTVAALGHLTLEIQALLMRWSQ